MLQKDKVLALPLSLYSSPFSRLSVRLSMRSLLLFCPKQERPSSQAYFEDFLKVIVRFTSAACSPAPNTSGNVGCRTS